MLCKLDSCKLIYIYGTDVISFKTMYSILHYISATSCTVEASYRFLDLKTKTKQNGLILNHVQLYVICLKPTFGVCRISLKKPRSFKEGRKVPEE